MNILQVIPVFNPPELYGGSQEVVYQISKELVRRGHNVTVYTSDAKRSNLKERVYKSAYRIDGIEVVHFRNISPLLAEKVGLVLTPTMKAALKRQAKNFDVVHVHELRGYQQIVVCMCAKRLKLPYVIHGHGILGMPRGLLEKFCDLSYVPKILANASRAIALTDYEIEQYMRIGVAKSRIRTIPNSIDLSEYTFFPPKGSFKKMFGIGDDEKIVLYVGRIHESKGLDLLVRAFKIVSENIGGVKLVVIGSDDGYAANLSRLISGLRLEKKVILTGFVEKSVKFAAFIDSEVFVTPCFSGFPITFLESCLAGCPIITASDELDWVNNNIGYVTEFSSAAIAKATIKLIQDEQINREFRKNCKQTIKNFDISTVTCQLEKVYQEAILFGCH
jgi:glycosyltransferase involved in cell wall biosynthesis